MERIYLNFPIQKFSERFIQMTCETMTNEVLLGITNGRKRIFVRFYKILSVYTKSSDTTLFREFSMIFITLTAKPILLLEIVCLILDLLK